MTDAIRDRAAKWNVVDPVNGHVLKQFYSEDEALDYWRSLPYPERAKVEPDAGR